MLGKKTNCTKCNFEYDEAQSHCLECNEPNLNRKKKYQTPFPWFPIELELTFTLVGIFGFLLISLIIGLIIGLTDLSTTNPTLYLTLYNSISYIILLVIFIILIIIYRKYISHYLRKIENYLFGFISGILLIGLSIAVNLIVNQFYQGTGGNQSAIIDMVKGYPVISVIILCIVGPICEEITYRLGLFSLLARKNKVLAYLVTILVFALMHIKLFGQNVDYVAEAWSIPSYIVGATMLTLAYDRFGFEGSVIAHIINNVYSIVCIILIA